MTLQGAALASLPNPILRNAAGRPDLQVRTAEALGDGLARPGLDADAPAVDGRPAT